MPIKPVNEHYSFTNPPSIYDEEAMTALELAGRQAAKINEVVNDQNALRTETETHLSEQDADIENQKSKVIPEKIAAEVVKHIEDGSFTDEIDHHTRALLGQIESTEAALSARMDTFTKLGEGSTTGDAELQDARVSHMGSTHANLGTHLRKMNALLRMNGAPDCVKQQDVYSLFKHAYVDGGTHGGGGNCIALAPPISFDRPITVRTIPGYNVSGNKWNGAWTDGNKTSSAGYVGWRKEILMNPGEWWTLGIRKEDTTQYISPDEGYALEFIEPFYYGETYGNALDVILPLFRHGGYLDTYDGVYSPNYQNAMYTHGGFTLPTETVLHCKGEADFAFHGYKNNTVSHPNKISDSGWCKTLTIPANTFGVIYFRKSAARPDMTLDDLKLIEIGPVYSDAVTAGTIHRRYTEPHRTAVAHRGYAYYGTYAPENTLPAFKLAKKNGFDWIECDVRISADGIPVICHDTTVDRTSNGSGNVAEKTLAELKALDFSEGCNIDRYKGTKLPTLEETLICCKNIGLNIWLEVEPECVNNESKIVELVRMYGMENAVKYVSFSASVLGNIAKLDPSAPLGLNAETPNDGHISQAINLRTGINDVSLNVTNTDAAFITACKTNRIPVEVWCPNDAAVIRSLDPYVRAVCSDYQNYERIMHDAEMAGV